jgi:uncharacterized membrane protein
MSDSSGNVLPPVTLTAEGAVEPASSLVTLTQIVYGLHALSLVIGAFGAATVIGAFLFGWPSIIAVVINYVKRSEVRGTWLESHFRWQIRTFWYALLWATIVVLVSLPLTLVLIGFATWVVGLFALGVWAIYRVVRGWLALNERRPIA